MAPESGECRRPLEAGCRTSKRSTRWTGRRRSDVPGFGIVGSAVQRRRASAVALLAGALGLASSAAADADASDGNDRIDITRTGPDSFDVSLAVARAMTEREALNLLRNEFGTRCGDRTAHLERYEFEGTGSLADATDADAFVLRGVVRCAEPASERADRERSALTESADAVRARIRRLSSDYLRDLAEGGPDAVMDRRSNTLDAMARRVQARTGERDRETGAVLSLDVTELTIYDDPPSAPQPGLYVAADYTARFETVPVQCGYLVWLRDAAAALGDREDARWTVVREEATRLSAAQLAGLTPEARARAERSIGCKPG